MGRIILEVAVESVEDAVCARRAGADRLELCSALEVGGLTPSIGLLRAVRAAVDVPILAMIRPRAGGFCYTESEMAVMRADIEALSAAGADGVVLGVLTREFCIDAPRSKSLLSAASGRPAVFHRAFDLTPDPFSALETLIELGFRRVLTSGQQAAATESLAVALIGRLIDRAADRLEILPGSGVRAENVRPLIEQAGCRQVHGGFRAASVECGLGERGSQFGFGVPGAHDHLSHTSEAQVRTMRLALDSLTA